MSRAWISTSLRERIAAQAKYRCGYCQSQELLVGAAMVIDHLFPEARGGLSEESNLWLACAGCNVYKGDRISGADPINSQLVRLFNPRTQVWSQHFAWSDDGLTIEGLTPTGRGTVVALKLNRPHLVISRAQWRRLGIHPPRDV